MKTRFKVIKTFNTDCEYKPFYLRIQTFEVKELKSIIITNLNHKRGWVEFELFNLNLYKIYLILKEE